MSLQINFIWLGTGKLRPLDVFNVYSWRALGHAVTIYAFHFNGTHDHASLGISHDAAHLVDLPKLVEADDKFAQGFRHLPDSAHLDEPEYVDVIKNTATIRHVMKAWYDSVAPDTPCTIEHIYNMADITKSYIAGTRRGIVLDLKIGPSEHVRTCEAAGVFSNCFVSFQRGSSTFGDLPENQCMGTMQIGHVLRGAYIKRFDQALATFDAYKERASKPNDKHFDYLTGLHGKGWVAVQKLRGAMDVAAPTQMARLGLGGLSVKEIDDEVSFGPFRVFKRKADQTNTSMASTSADEQIDLCAYTCQRQETLGLIVNDDFQKERRRAAVRWKTGMYFDFT
jgi:hypothetical protein